MNWQVILGWSLFAVFAIASIIVVIMAAFPGNQPVCSACGAILDCVRHCPTHPSICCVCYGHPITTTITKDHPVT